MTIRPAAAKPGLVFHDPEAGASTPLYWKMLRPAETGGWVCEEVNHRVRERTRVFTEAELTRMHAVPSVPLLDFDLDALIGKRVRVRTPSGWAFSGTLVRINHVKIKVTGRTARIPVELNVDGDMCPIHLVREVVLADL